MNPVSAPLSSNLPAVAVNFATMNASIRSHAVLQLCLQVQYFNMGTQPVQLDGAANVSTQSVQAADRGAAAAMQQAIDMMDAYALPPSSPDVEAIQADTGVRKCLWIHSDP